MIAAARIGGPTTPVSATVLIETAPVRRGLLQQLRSKQTPSGETWNKHLARVV